MPAGNLAPQYSKPCPPPPNILNLPTSMICTKFVKISQRVSDLHSRVDARVIANVDARTDGCTNGLQTGSLYRTMPKAGAKKRRLPEVVWVLLRYFSTFAKGEQLLCLPRSTKISRLLKRKPVPSGAKFRFFYILYIIFIDLFISESTGVHKAIFIAKIDFTNFCRLIVLCIVV